MEDQKIAVLGAGANGAAIGADLTEAGLDVTLIEQWPEHVEMMRTNGVTVTLADEVRRVPVRVIHLCEVATLRSRFDVVLMLMKAYDSRWASELVKPYLASDGLLIGVQNGMTVDTIADVVGHDRTLGCVIEISSMMFEPGLVERHSGRERSWFGLGALTDRMENRVGEVAEILEFSGTVEVFDDIRAAKWMKLVSNACTLAPTAILGLPILKAATIPEMRQLMLAAGREAMTAMVSEGLQVLPIFGMDPETVSITPDRDSSRKADVVEPMLDWLIERFVLPDTRTTVLQDWIKGRRSEVDDINGLVAATNQHHGLASPVNEIVVETAHRIERHEIDPARSNLELLLADAFARGWTLESTR